MQQIFWYEEDKEKKKNHEWNFSGLRIRSIFKIKNILEHESWEVNYWINKFFTFYESKEFVN